MTSLHSCLPTFLLVCLLSSSWAMRLAECEMHINSTDHSLIDLDQRMIEEEDTEIGRVYVMGVHSENSNGTMRTIQSLSTETESKFRGEGHFELYRAYYKRSDYADRFIQSALGGVGEFRDVEKDFRMKAAKLGTKVLNLWMYAIHELENAINYCYAGETELAIKQWEDSWAIYAGSLEGTDGSGNGMLFYGMSEKKCNYFGTCTAAGKSPVNNALIQLFNEGREYVYAGACEKAIDVKIEYTKKLTVPLMQGLLYNMQKVVYNSDAAMEHYAKALVFSRGVLPQLDHCSSDAAAKIASAILPIGPYSFSNDIATLARAVYAQLGCMGITCKEVGSLPGLPLCSTSGSYKPVPGADLPSEGTGPTSEPEVTEEPAE